MNLTIRQRDLMLFIQRYVDEHQCSPSFEEMKVAIGAKSKSQVAWLVDELEARGFLQKVPHRRRGLEVLKRLPAAVAPIGLTQAAIALAQRTLEYVGDGEIEPHMNCDIEMQTLARAVLAEAGERP